MFNQLDKLKHILYSIVGTGFLYVGTNIFINKTHSLIISIGIMFLIGLLKEVIWDYIMGRGKFEWLDLLSNIIGIIIATLLIIL